jgi:hypothetical protein
MSVTRTDGQTGKPAAVCGPGEVAGVGGAVDGGTVCGGVVPGVVPGEVVAPVVGRVVGGRVVGGRVVLVVVGAVLVGTGTGISELLEGTADSDDRVPTPPVGASWLVAGLPESGSGRTPEVTTAEPAAPAPVTAVPPSDLLQPVSTRAPTASRTITGVRGIRTMDVTYVRIIGAQNVC